MVRQSDSLSVAGRAVVHPEGVLDLPRLHLRFITVDLA